MKTQKSVYNTIITIPFFFQKHVQEANYIQFHSLCSRKCYFKIKILVNNNKNNNNNNISNNNKCDNSNNILVQD